MAADFRPSRKRRRAAWATALSVVLHVLALTGMVVGLKVVEPPPEERAMELTLVRPLEPVRTPRPVERSPERAAVAPALKPRRPPQVSPSAPAAALPETPAPPAAPKRDYGPKVESGPDDYALSGKMGCDDPLGMKLTPAQRQACAGKLGRLVQGMKPLDNIPERARRDFDRTASCQENRRARNVPQMNPAAGAEPSANPNPSNINPYYGANVGIGKGDGGPCP